MYNRRDYIKQETESITAVALDLVQKNKPIQSIQVVVDAVKQSTGLDVKRVKVAKTLRKKLHMGYRFAKTVPI